MTRPGRGRAMVGLLLSLSLVVLGAVPALAWRSGVGLPLHATSAAWPERRHDHHTVGAVTIKGVVVQSLSPGISSAIEVKLKNPTRHRLLLRRVKVTITAISAPRADAAHACTRLDYQFKQMPRMILRLPARRTVGLAELGVPMTSWPHLAMRDRPLNQDGCQGAQLTLRFRAHEVRRGGRS